MATAHEDARRAVLSLAEIKAAIEDFDRGDCNLFDALDRVKIALVHIEAANEPEQDAA